MHDWRTRGRPHKAYIYGGFFVLLETFAVVPISATQWWLSFATGFEHLFG